MDQSYGEFEVFMALSMVQKHNRRRGYTTPPHCFPWMRPLLSSNTYAWHLLNSQAEKLRSFF
jgi:hypothetical protein